MRHKKFSSVGNDLTDEVKNGHTYITDRKIDNIVIHCSATPNQRDHDAQDIDNMHINRWGYNSGCGYHYVIKLDGSIEKGRWADYAGAHVRGHNKYTIGICYIGGVDNNLKSLFDQATDKQLESMHKLVDILCNAYNLKKDDVLGHNEFKGVHKDCPCLTMDEFRTNLQ